MIRDPGQLRGKENEEGYLLVGAIVAVFLVMLALSIAAPVVAKQLQREREVEAAHRANEYVRAIRLYYRKFGHYPGNIDQLKNSNNQKFLRQEYLDPFTGQADWRLIHVGEAKTKVKGFFGEDLPGLPTASLGSAAGMSSNGFGASGANGASTSAFGSSTGSSSGNSFGSPAAAGTGSSGTGSASGTAAGSGSGTNSSGAGISSQDATTFTGGGAPIMGIGIPHSGGSILVVNEQTDYVDWEFLYDPRIEQMYAKSSLLGGVPSTSATGLGSASGMNSGVGAGASPGSINGTGTPAGTTSPTTPPNGTSTTPQ